MDHALVDKNWKHAMDVEFDGLHRNKTWHLVQPQKGKHVIDCKWVYKIKRQLDGKIDRYKPRWLRGLSKDMVLILKTLLLMWLKGSYNSTCVVTCKQETGV